MTLHFFRTLVQKLSIVYTKRIQNVVRERTVDHGGEFWSIFQTITKRKQLFNSGSSSGFFEICPYSTLTRPSTNSKRKVGPDVTIKYKLRLHCVSFKHLTFVTHLYFYRLQVFVFFLREQAKSTPHKYHCFLTSFLFFIPFLIFFRHGFTFPYQYIYFLFLVFLQPLCCKLSFENNLFRNSLFLPNLSFYRVMFRVIYLFFMFQSLSEIYLFNLFGCILIMSKKFNLLFPQTSVSIQVFLIFVNLLVRL